MMLRCHAFASKAKWQQKNYYRSVNTLRLDRRTKNHPLIIRGGGSWYNMRNPLLSSKANATTRLPSTLSPLRDSGSLTEKETFERRVLDSLQIASGGPIPTTISSFGGLTYQDTSTSKFSSLFRVVFVLGGPGKFTVSLIGNSLKNDVTVNIISKLYRRFTCYAFSILCCGSK